MFIGPISVFDCVKSNQADECLTLTYDEFVAAMAGFAEDRFNSKHDAPLICFTQFDGGKRAKANATHTGMVVLDIDDHLTIGDVDQALSEAEIAALLCSTASHRPDQHKFRVFIPLAEPADYDDHVLAWHVINHAIADGQADSSKIGCESMFFVPGKYPDAPCEFRVYEGISLTAHDWIAVFGSREDVQALTGKKVTSPRQKSPSPHAVRRLPSNADLDLHRTRLVSDKALDAYRAPPGAYHHARFSLLLSMARRAKRLNRSVSPHDLVAIFNQIDLEDGGHYQSHDYQKALLAEAQKAINLT